MEFSHSYFVVGNLASTQEEVVRIAGLLRGTESAVQAVSVSSDRFQFLKFRPAHILAVWLEQCRYHGGHRGRLSELWALGDSFGSCMASCEAHRSRFGRSEGGERETS